MVVVGSLRPHSGLAECEEGEEEYVGDDPQGNGTDAPNDLDVVA